MTKEQLKTLRNLLSKASISSCDIPTITSDDTTLFVALRNNAEFLIDAALENDNLSEKLADALEHQALYRENIRCDCSENDACIFVEDKDKLQKIILSIKEMLYEISNWREHTDMTDKENDNPNREYCDDIYLIKEYAQLTLDNLVNRTDKKNKDIK